MEVRKRNMRGKKEKNQRKRKRERNEERERKKILERKHALKKILRNRNDFIETNTTPSKHIFRTFFSLSLFLSFFFS